MCPTDYRAGCQNIGVLRQDHAPDRKTLCTSSGAEAPQELPVGACQLLMHDEIRHGRRLLHYLFHGCIVPSITYAAGVDDV